MTAATLPRPARDVGVGVGGNVTAAQGSQDKRRSLWLLLRGRAMAHQELKPENLRISNEVGRAILREGVSGRVLMPLAELLELGPTQLGPVIGMNRTTVRRYVRKDQTLPTHTAETILRLAELEAVVLDVFASQPAAHDWLKTEHPLLGESPITAASTSYGAERVREILTAVRYGGAV